MKLNGTPSPSRDCVATTRQQQHPSEQQRYHGSDDRPVPPRTNEIDTGVERGVVGEEQGYREQDRRHEVGVVVRGGLLAGLCCRFRLGDRCLVVAELLVEVVGVLVLGSRVRDQRGSVAIRQCDSAAVGAGR